MELTLNVNFYFLYSSACVRDFLVKVPQSRGMGTYLVEDLGWHQHRVSSLTK